MKYEMNMQTGEKDRPVIEVGDRFFHRSAFMGLTVKTILRDSAASAYVVEDDFGNVITMTRRTLLRDCDYMSDEVRLLNKLTLKPYDSIQRSKEEF